MQSIIIKSHNKTKKIKEIAKYLNSIEYKIPIKVGIEKLNKKRSLNQNAVYWIWIKIICIEQDGNFNPSKLDLEDKHESFKEHFIPPRRTKSGRKYYTTKPLKTNEFNDYMEKVRMLVIEYLGLSLFYPSDGQVFNEMLAHYNL